MADKEIEDDDDENDDDTEDGSDYLELSTDTLCIYDMKVFAELTGSIATHVTPDGSVWILKRDGLVWACFPVEEVKSKAKKSPFKTVDP